ncbi:MAG: IS110 family transposase [Candidatus Omnitrophota bacterium]
MKKTNYNLQNYDTFMGIDVDSKSYAFTVADHKNIQKSKKIPADSQMLVQYIQKHFPTNRVLCAFEAGGTGFELFDTLEFNNISCWVVSPNAIAKPANAMVKNNRIDSKLIAQTIKTGNVNPIRVPSQVFRELRHLVRIYDNYSQIQSISKQRIKALLLFESLHKTFVFSNTRWTRQFLLELKQCPCSVAARSRLDALLDDLTYARLHLAKSLRAIKQFCYQCNEIKEYINYLISIPGVGIRTASYILAKIGDPSLLRSPRELGSFFGLTPKENSTGDKIYKGSISHAGTAIGRSLLIEAAWIAIRYDKELRQFYDRIKSRNPKQSAAKKAIVAVARKLTARIYAVLKNKKEYVVIH